MASILNYNERAWAIDLISEINIACQKKNYAVKSAGGERTISIGDGKSLFPDVLLFSDSEGSSAIQGWELKMPDTSITDREFIENAISKAKRLQFNSFLLWNVKEAVLYVSEDFDTYLPVKSWFVEAIEKRADVLKNQNNWKKLLYEILDYVSESIGEQYISLSTIENFVGDNLYTDILSRHASGQSKYIKDLAIKDLNFDVLLDSWYEENRNEYRGLSREKALAQIIIVNWINIVLFGHYLKVFYSKAEKIDDIKGDITPVEALKVLKKISADCNFKNIFNTSLWLEHADNELWRTIKELNGILSDFKIEEISHDSLHNFLDNLLFYSKKKIAGQFSTPPKLAHYLVGITVKDRTQHVIDPCCGTGTIAKAVLDLKLTKGLNIYDTVRTTWASDKFSFPLQLSTLALSAPSAMGEVIQVFQADALTLQQDQKISFTEPFTGSTVIKKLPRMHSIVSNLPFVRFEDIEKLNPAINKARKGLLDKGVILSEKSDLYSYLIFTLGSLIDENGRLGVIVSNSWLGTGWGNEFRNKILEHFDIVYVIISSNGRWFHNADVVTTIIVLENKKKEDNDIEFIRTLKDINDWDESTLKNMISDTILFPRNNTINKEVYKRTDIKELESYGFSWNSFFVNFKWIEDVKERLIPVAKFCSISRGKRRGWDALFYPSPGHGIEDEYLKPVLLSPRELNGNLIIQANNDAFCCSDEIEELERKGMTGALNWIRQFEFATNNVGTPLKESLAMSNRHWYEMRPDTLADIVVSINPDRRLCFYRLKERSFVNQRFISFTVNKQQLEKINILHALLNSAIGLFVLESIGFGRGQAALDLNATKVSQRMRILNPDILSWKECKKIESAFELLLKRPVKNIEQELLMEDRINFDLAVLDAFELKVDHRHIYDSLLDLHNMRQTARR